MILIQDLDSSLIIENTSELIQTGDLVVAAGERIAGSWLVRQGCGELAHFNSLSTIYMGEQILDSLLQALEIRSTRAPEI